MRARQVLRVARWELARGRAAVDRRAGVGVALLVLGLVALAPVLAGAGAAPGSGIYRVAVDEDSRYRAAVASADELRAASASGDPLAADRADVLVAGGDVRFSDTRKGRAAAAAFRSAVLAYNDRLLADDPDSVAAFPVRVTLSVRDRPAIVTGGGGGDDTGDTGGGSGDGTGGTRDGSDDGTSGGDTSGSDTGGGGGLGSVGEALFGGTQSGTPGGIRPPFPLRSLVLAFLFVVPLNAVVQAYGSSVLGERLNRRGEPLLVAPVSRGDVVAGKTLPYLLAALGAATAIALAIGAGPVSVLAVTPLALAFLAATFLAALFSRSYRELTFVTVTASVFLTSYAFVPAVFTEVHPVAAVSPLTLVVRDLTGAAVRPGTALVALGPMTLASLVAFALGAGVVREEDMFTQRSVPAKALDALAARLRRPRDAALWAALFVPFVLVAELFAVALLFVLPTAVSLPLLLAVLACVEELAKSAHVYAGFARARFPRTDRTALVAGALAGVGFAVGEKALLVVQVVGLPDIELGRVAFASASADGATALALLAAPFALHAVTAAVSALGARRSRTAYAGAFGVAVVVHVLYNLAVVSALG